MQASTGLSVCLLLAIFWTSDATVRTQKTTYRVKPQERTYHYRPPGDWWVPEYHRPISVGAHFDMNGIEGTIHFYQSRKGLPVTVTVRISGLAQFPNERWGWHIHEHNINWGLLEENPCSNEHICGVYDPENLFDTPNYPVLCAADQSQCRVGDLAGRHGPLRANQSVYTFQDTKLDLYDVYSPIGRSINIHRQNGFRWACANIEYDGHQSLMTYVAAFPCNPKEQNPVFQGEIIMRRSAHRYGVTLEVNLARVDGGPINISHNWSLWTGEHNFDGCNTCDLTHIYGTRTHPKRPDYSRGVTCGSGSHAQQNQCPFGKLMAKCGLLEYTCGGEGVIQAFCTDNQLGSYPPDHILDYTSIVIQDEDGDILACSRFEPIVPRSAVVRFRSGYIWVHAWFFQYDPHDPTYVRFHVGGLFRQAIGFQVRWNSVPSNGSCVGLGPVYEPRTYFLNYPPSIFVNQTGDRDFVGELRYKLLPLNGLYNYYNQQRNSYIPLFGDYSIIGRSLVLLNTAEQVIGCGNITNYDPNYTAYIRRYYEAYH